MRFFVVILIALAININSSISQINAGSDSLKLQSSSVVNRNPFSRLGNDLFGQFKGAFNINSGNILYIGAGVFLTGVLLSTDQATYNTIRRIKRNNTWVRDAAPYFSNIGSLYGPGIVAGFAALGFLTGNSKAMETSYLAAESVLCSGIWTKTLKAITGRERPSATTLHSHKSGGKWSGPGGFFGHKTGGNTFSSYDAFPSGHTATAFSIATVFANQYAENLVVPIISYSLAGIVGIARIVEDTHWASDVLVGGIIGYLTSKQIMLNNPSELSRKESQFTTAPKKDSFFKHIQYGLNPFDGTLALSYNF